MNVVAADPFVLFDEQSGYYYCYATSVPSGNKAFLIYKSKDRVHWTFVDYALDLSKNSWGKDWYWAPECYYNPNNKHYYLFYSAKVKDELIPYYFGVKEYDECCRIGVAVSASPEGPFINISDRPIDYLPYDKDYLDINRVCKNPFEKNTPSPREISIPKGTYVSTIDANLFFEDGKIYLYFSRCCYQNCIYDEDLHKYIEESNIAVVELNTDWWFDKAAKTMPTIKEEFINSHNDDGVGRKDGYVRVINYASQKQDWENGHVNDFEDGHGSNRRWAEGSTLFTRMIDGKKKYCITYSCNNYENALYGVGIAFSDKPLSTFKKFEGNPIIHQISDFPLYSTGHGSLVEKDDKMYYFFHGRESVEEDRIMYVGEIHINNEHDIYVDNIVKAELL